MTIPSLVLLETLIAIQRLAYSYVVIANICCGLHTQC